MDRDDQNEAGIGLPLRLRFADQLDQPTLLERVDRVTPREIAGHCLYRINFGSPGDEAESHEGNTYAPDREDAAEKIRQGWEQPYPVGGSRRCSRLRTNEAA